MMLVCYGMLVEFHQHFTSYEMQVETHVRVQIEKQLGFHEL